MNFIAIFWFLVAASAAGLVWVCWSSSRLALGLVFLFGLGALAWAGFWNLHPETATAARFHFRSVASWSQRISSARIFIRIIQYLDSCIGKRNTCLQARRSTASPLKHPLRT